VHHHDHVCEEYFQSVLDDMATAFGWLTVAGLVVGVATAFAVPVVAAVGIIISVVGTVGFFFGEYMLTPARDECKMAVGLNAQTMGDMANVIVQTDVGVSLLNVGKTSEVDTLANDLREFLENDSIMFPDELRGYVGQGIDHAMGMGKLDRLTDGNQNLGDWEVAMYYVIEGAAQAAFQNYTPPPPPL
jgi:hypothetical protein